MQEADPVGQFLRVHAWREVLLARRPFDRQPFHDRAAADKRDERVIAASREKTIAAAKIMDEQLGRTAFMAGDEFSYGDIPVGIMIYRHVQLVPERPTTPNLDRWYAAIAARAAFKAQMASVPLT